MDDLSFLRPLPISGKIRLGSDHDGGYVVYRRLLNETDALVTYGIGWDIAFEEHFNRLTAKKVFMFDPTLVGKYLVNVKALQEALSKAQFKAALGHLEAGWRLWEKKRQLKSAGIFFVNEGLAANRLDKYDTFGAHIERFGLGRKRLLLKVDIEGGEYPIFQDKRIFDHLSRVNQLIIEVHDLQNRLSEWREIATELGKQFKLVHIHGNNFGQRFYLRTLSGKILNIPDTLEFLFVRKDLIDFDDILSEPLSYPIAGLDFPNDPRRKDYAINFL